MDLLAHDRDSLCSGIELLIPLPDLSPSFTRRARKPVMNCLLLRTRETQTHALIRICSRANGATMHFRCVLKLVMRSATEERIWFRI